MPTGVTAQRWGDKQPPAGTPFDPSSSLWRGLMVWYNANTGGRAFIQDLGPRRLHIETVSNFSPEYIHRDGQLAIQHNGYGSLESRSSPSQTNNVIGTNNFTIFARGGDTATRASAGPDCILMLDRFNTGVGIYTATNGTGTPWGIWCGSREDANTTYVENITNTFLARRSGTGTNELEFYLDGVADGTQTNSNNVTATNNDSVFFNENGAGNEAQSFMFCGAIWSRALTDQEVERVSLAPYDSMVPRRLLFNFDVPAGGAAHPVNPLGHPLRGAFAGPIG